MLFKFIAILISPVFMSILFAVGDVIVSGQVTYYDVDIGAIVPLSNTKVVMTTVDPVEMDPVYTDNDGYYSFSFYGAEPEQIIIRLYFSNSRIEIRGWGGPRNDFQDFYPLYPENPECPPEIPCWYELDYYITADFNYSVEQIYNDYSKLFSEADFAAEFAISNGANPPQVIIKYPAGSCIISDYTIMGIESSFTWPYETINWYNANNVIPGGCNYIAMISAILYPHIDAIIALMALNGNVFQLTENTIYLASNASYEGNKSTVYHEYAHFLHRSLRGGSWPITVCEYFNGEEVPNHTYNDYDQTEKQAFVEGYANFYGSVVESYYNNPTNPYSGDYDGVDWFIEDLSSHYGFDFDDVINGLNNELTVAGSLFDLYDPINGRDIDYFQMPMEEIFNYISLCDNTTLSFMERIKADKSYDEFSPFLYALDKNKVQNVSDFSNFCKLEMHNRSSNNDNLGNSLVFEDDLNEIDITINSFENQDVPVMIGTSYNVETNLLNSGTNFFMNWGRPDYFFVRQENYEIEQDPNGIEAEFEQKFDFSIISTSQTSFWIKDPWWIDPAIGEQHLEPIFNELESGISYQVFLDQNENFDPDLPIYSIKVPHFYYEDETIYEFSGWVVSQTGGTPDAVFSVAGNGPWDSDVVYKNADAIIEPQYTSVNNIQGHIFTIYPGEELTIPPGANIAFAQNFVIKLRSGSTLNIIGENDSPITLTSEGYGDWKGIKIYHDGSPGSEGTLNIANCIVRDADKAIHIWGDDLAPIGDLQTHILTLNKVEFSDNEYAIYFNNDHEAYLDGIATEFQLDIRNCTFVNNTTHIKMFDLDGLIQLNFETSMFANIFYGGQIRMDILLPTSYMSKPRYNTFFDCDIQNEVISNHSITFGNNQFDPDFVNVLSHDYTLNPTSPCRDTGWLGPNPPNYFDPDGTIIDRGAYYYDAIPPIPTNLTKSGGFGQHPTISWDPVSALDFDHYVLMTEYNGPNNSFTDYVNLTTTSYIDLAYTIQKFGTDVATYSVCSVDWAEQCSDFSNEQNVNGSGGGMARYSVADAGLPTEYALHSAYPNPFNPLTMFDYDLPESGFTNIVIYDITGHEVDQLVNTYEEAGYHKIQWDATSHPSGAYIVKLVSGDFIAKQKIALVK